jgi:hypothetical protein
MGEEYGVEEKEMGVEKERECRKYFCRFLVFLFFSSVCAMNGKVGHPWRIWILEVLIRSFV